MSYHPLLVWVPPLCSVTLFTLTHFYQGPLLNICLLTSLFISLAVSFSNWIQLTQAMGDPNRPNQGKLPNSPHRSTVEDEPTVTYHYPRSRTQKQLDPEPPLGDFQSMIDASAMEGHDVLKSKAIGLYIYRMAPSLEILQLHKPWSGCLYPEHPEGKRTLKETAHKSICKAAGLNPKDLEIESDSERDIRFEVVGPDGKRTVKYVTYWMARMSPEVTITKHYKWVPLEQVLKNIIDKDLANWLIDWSDHIDCNFV